MIKKFLILVAIFAIISLPILAQDSPPANLNINANMSGGCFVGVGSGATWANIPVPTTPAEVNAYVLADEGAIPVFLAYRLELGHLAKLILEAEGIDYNGNPDAYQPSLSLWHTWAEDVIFDGAAPERLVQQEIWTSVNERGRKEATISIGFMNKIDRPAGAYSANFVLTLLDVVE